MPVTSSCWDMYFELSALKSTRACNRSRREKLPISEPLFGNSQPLARELHRITEIAAGAGSAAHNCNTRPSSVATKSSIVMRVLSSAHLLQLSAAACSWCGCGIRRKASSSGRNAGVEGLIVNAVVRSRRPPRAESCAHCPAPRCSRPSRVDRSAACRHWPPSRRCR